MATRWWYTQAGTIVGFLADDGKWFYKQSGETFGYIGGTLDLRGGRHADRLLRQCRLDLPATGRQSKTGFHLETPILEQLSAEHRQYMLQRIPLGRPGGPAVGSGRAHRLARQRRGQLHDRPVHRHQRRTRDLLTVVRAAEVRVRRLLVDTKQPPPNVAEFEATRVHVGRAT